MKTKDYRFPMETLERWEKDADWRVRKAAAEACKGRADIPLDLLERLAKDDELAVRYAVAKACKGRDDIPLEFLERFAQDDDWRVRYAVAQACKGWEDIPLEFLALLLKDRDSDVRSAAIKAIGSRKDVPLIREIEPPETVYKKCRNNVIIEAHIPEDAQVRGSAGGKCRSNKAIITGIRGDYYGEPIGVSIYDAETCYVVGEELEVEDFDYSSEECGTGFHFFCTLEEAEDYEW